MSSFEIPRGPLLDKKSASLLRLPGSYTASVINELEQSRRSTMNMFTGSVYATAAVFVAGLALLLVGAVAEALTVTASSLVALAGVAAYVRPDKQVTDLLYDRSSPQMRAAERVVVAAMLRADGLDGFDMSMFDDIWVLDAGLAQVLFALGLSPALLPQIREMAPIFTGTGSALVGTIKTLYPDGAVPRTVNALTHLGATHRNFSDGT